MADKPNTEEAKTPLWPVLRDELLLPVMKEKQLPVLRKLVGDTLGS